MRAKLKNIVYGTLAAGAIVASGAAVIQKIVAIEQLKEERIEMPSPTVPIHASPFMFYYKSDEICSYHKIEGKYQIHGDTHIHPLMNYTIKEGHADFFLHSHELLRFRDQVFYFDIWMIDPKGTPSRKRTFLNDHGGIFTTITPKAPAYTRIFSLTDG